MTAPATAPSGPATQVLRPAPARQRDWPIVPIAAVAALLLVAGGALAIVLTNDGSSGDSAAGRADAAERPGRPVHDRDPPQRPDHHGRAGDDHGSDDHDGTSPPQRLQPRRAADDDEPADHHDAACHHHRADHDGAARHDHRPHDDRHHARDDARRARPRRPAREGALLRDVRPGAPTERQCDRGPARRRRRDRRAAGRRSAAAGSRRPRRLRRRVALARATRGRLRRGDRGVSRSLRRPAGPAPRRTRPLVFDAVLSLENELVTVRRRFRDRSRRRPSSAPSTCARCGSRTWSSAGATPRPATCAAVGQANRRRLPGRRRGALLRDVVARLPVHGAPHRRRFRRGRPRQPHGAGTPVRVRKPARSSRTSSGSPSRTPASCSAASASRARSPPSSSRRSRQARR